MIARGGFNWIIGAILVSTLVITLYLYLGNFIFFILSILFIIETCFLLLFFRDPNRQIAKGIVSPADGTVLSITTPNPDTLRLAIFMSVANVHVNRAPVRGDVVSTIHRPGGFIPAYDHRSRQNERLVTTLRTRLGIIKVIQIAGILARRIVPYIGPGDRVLKGQRIGIIQFGSRVDLIIPRYKVRMLVNPGDRVWAGSTSVAEIVNVE